MTMMQCNAYSYQEMMDNGYKTKEENSLRENECREIVAKKKKEYLLAKKKLKKLIKKHDDFNRKFDWQTKRIIAALADGGICSEDISTITRVPLKRVEEIIFELKFLLVFLTKTS